MLYESAECGRNKLCLYCTAILFYYVIIVTFQFYNALEQKNAKCMLVSYNAILFHRLYVRDMVIILN